MPAPHPPEFRRRAVELARDVDEDGVRKHPIARLDRDLKVSESCLRNWMVAEEIEAGDRPGLTKDEREELVRLRRENRTLRMERDLLSRSAAFFAFPVRLTCGVFGFSTQALYKWKARPRSVQSTVLPGHPRVGWAHRVDGSRGLGRGQRGDGVVLRAAAANVLNQRRWRTRNELSYAISFWIERTYNRRRRQRVLGKLTPVEFEFAFTPAAVHVGHDLSQPPSTEPAAIAFADDHSETVAEGTKPLELVSS